jgi:hypothetical protein
MQHNTLAQMSDMGFTVNTLIAMTEQELDEVIQTWLKIFILSFYWESDMGLKAAI